ncbi:uncharacterized protein PpBr36_09303 [Pyricularia pennisetigena]|uniref:uncharacterized protein n=1 Tax=Pyricularia pennisetigena TaxID=1578925 RepID=UPI001150CCD5|nr:uncharacterized protein PpBr36_09303 [Pyricularia pennisetigena]TLS21791.1 hypothetical protein PpBr36_09303 [Pyricularia pennisetigena]
MPSTDVLLNRGGLHVKDLVEILDNVRYTSRRVKPVAAVWILPPFNSGTEATEGVSQGATTADKYQGVVGRVLQKHRSVPDCNIILWRIFNVQYLARVSQGTARERHPGAEPKECRKTTACSARMDRGCGALADAGEDDPVVATAEDGGLPSQDAADEQDAFPQPGRLMLFAIGEVLHIPNVEPLLPRLPWKRSARVRLGLGENPAKGWEGLVERAAISGARVEKRLGKSLCGAASSVEEDDRVGVCRGGWDVEEIVGVHYRTLFGLI